MMRAVVMAVAIGLAAAPAAAQGFTTAADVRPILEMTQMNWVAVREYDGQDLVYFTGLLSWRCGLEAVFYRVNGAEEVALEMEPCHEGTAQPNAITAEAGMIYITQPLGSVASVAVRVVYDDGKEASVKVARAQILMP